METDKVVLKRVESRGGGSYAELTEDKYGFAYSMTGGGGSMGRMNLDEAVRYFDTRVIPMFQPDANKSYRITVG